MTADAPPEEAPRAIGDTFDGFFRREYPALVALAAATCGDRSIAEDLAQEAMCRAHKRWARISAYDKPGAWVRRVTINLALSSRRRSGTEGRARLRLVGQAEAAVPPTERNDDIWAAVAALPGNQRAAIALHYLDDRSVREIAEVLECAEATARVHLHRGRAALHAALEGSER